uniref:DUF4216 domain-containing protein n=1 Tax=Oryza brachyantha TaxID=4533 RepID=J3LJ41_ORYBR
MASGEEVPRRKYYETSGRWLQHLNMHDGTRRRGTLLDIEGKSKDTRILPVSIRGIVRKDIYEAIAELGNFFKELCFKTLKIDVLLRLKAEIPVILCKLEKIYPPAFFDVMVHLAVHLPDEAILRGPVYIFRELEKNSVNDIDTRLEREFPKWFKNYIEELHYNRAPEVSNDLYSLANGPDRRLRVYSACNENGVRYHTIDREKNRKTQNSGIKVEGAHKNLIIDFYGVLIEILELQYTTNKNGDRSVFLFRCDWFDLDGRKTRMRNDGYFTSINIRGRWYKKDPFILAPQAKQVFYLDDTRFGKDWKVVQNFEHRHVYDVPEKERTETNENDDFQMNNQDAYQQESSSTEFITHFTVMMKMFWTFRLKWLKIFETKKAKILLMNFIVVTAKKNVKTIPGTIHINNGVDGPLSETDDE